MRLPRLKQQIVAKGVTWKFITALAPWQGGMWERLIRSTKRCLIKVIGRSLLTYAELSTLLVEVECILKSRPLTYIYDDQDGVSYLLTHRVRRTRELARSRDRGQQNKFKMVA